MSEIRVNTLSDAAGTGPATLTKQSAAKAWAEFNGLGTPAITVSFNVSSLIDGGTGVFDLSFTNAFAAAEYASSGSSYRDGIGFGIASPSIDLASQANAFVATAAGAFSDNSDNSFVYYGDLA